MINKSYVKLLFPCPEFACPELVEWTEESSSTTSPSTVLLRFKVFWFLGQDFLFSANMSSPTLESYGSFKFMAY